MKVAVFEVIMKDGTDGKVMVPYVSDREYLKFEAELRGQEGVKRANWEHNMWLSEPISGPITAKKVEAANAADLLASILSKALLGVARI